MSDISISVICVYNDKQQYQHMLETLSTQTASYELIGIDNTLGHFKSAASALNHGAALASSEYLIFVHQDVLFLSDYVLQKVVDDLSFMRDKKCVIGRFGAPESDLYIEHLKKVDTIDECFVAISRDVFNEFRFNEDTCDGWHLYAVELCLRMRLNGGDALTGEYEINHLSIGNVNDEYMKTYKKLIIQYKEMGNINTTCKSMRTSLIDYNVYYGMWKIKKIILGNYPLIDRLKNLNLKDTSC